MAQAIDAHEAGPNIDRNSATAAILQFCSDPTRLIAAISGLAFASAVAYQAGYFSAFDMTFSGFFNFEDTLSQALILFPIFLAMSPSALSLIARAAARELGFGKKTLTVLYFLFLAILLAATFFAVSIIASALVIAIYAVGNLSDSSSFEKLSSPARSIVKATQIFLCVLVAFFIFGRIESFSDFNSKLEYQIVTNENESFRASIMKVGSNAILVQQQDKRLMIIPRERIRSIDRPGIQLGSPVFSFSNVWNYFWGVSPPCPDRQC